jgi:tripartite-type tricarboxylate transporter receptor subunit TctC
VKATGRLDMIKKIGALAALVAIPLVAFPAFAAGYPERFVKLVVPFPPGGLVDVAARAIGNKMSPKLGQSVVIENKPGAAGTIAAELVARAPGDGYTLLFGTSANLGIAKYTLKDLPYDPVTDFTPVAILGNVTVGVFASAKSGINTPQDIIAQAKANPGKISYGSPGVGSVSHLAAELFRLRAGIDILHVPYAGTVPQMTDLARGETQLGFTGLGSGLTYVQKGDVKLVAVAAKSRSKTQPSTPALSEVVKGYDAPAWLGIVAPKGTPPDVVAKLAAAIRVALEDPQVKTLFDQQGIDPEPNVDSKAFGEKIKNEMKLWEEAVKASGLQKQERQ